MIHTRSVDPAIVGLLACLFLGGGCAEDRTSGHGKVAAEVGKPEAEEDSSASAWATSDDGKLSLRIVAAHGPIRADEPVWMLAELRNDSDQPLAVLRPFGDRYEARAIGFEITGPDGKVRYEGPTPTYVLGTDSFSYLAPSEVLLDSWSTDAFQDWMSLTNENHAGLGTLGRYSVRYTYKATPSHQEMAKQSRRFGDQERLWMGEIRTDAVTVSKAKSPRHANGGQSRPAVSVRIRSDEYRFTLAEVAAGVRFDYDLVVADDLEGVVPLPQDAGSALGGGPSGLIPFETIMGGGHSYGLFDVGLGKPDLRPRRIERGTYPHSFAWDGRNWGGPSDTGMPKGEPFPPGTYTLRVRVKGEIETPNGRKPYDVSDTAIVVLTHESPPLRQSSPSAATPP